MLADDATAELPCPLEPAAEGMLLIYCSPGKQGSPDDVILRRAAAPGKPATESPVTTKHPTSEDAFHDDEGNNSPPMSICVNVIGCMLADDATAELPCPLEPAAEGMLLIYCSPGKQGSPDDVILRRAAAPGKPATCVGSDGAVFVSFRSESPVTTKHPTSEDAFHDDEGNNSPPMSICVNVIGCMLADGATAELPCPLEPAAEGMLLIYCSPGKQGCPDDVILRRAAAPGKPATCVGSDGAVFVSFRSESPVTTKHPTSEDAFHDDEGNNSPPMSICVNVIGCMLADDATAELPCPLEPAAEGMLLIYCSPGKQGSPDDVILRRAAAPGKPATCVGSDGAVFVSFRSESPVTTKHPTSEDAFHDDEGNNSPPMSICVNVIGCMLADGATAELPCPLEPAAEGMLLIYCSPGKQGCPDDVILRRAAAPGKPATCVGSDGAVFVSFRSESPVTTKHPTSEDAFHDDEGNNSPPMSICVNVIGCMLADDATAELPCPLEPAAEGMLLIYCSPGKQGSPDDVILRRAAAPGKPATCSHPVSGLEVNVQTTKVVGASIDTLLVLDPDSGELEDLCSLRNHLGVVTSVASWLVRYDPAYFQQVLSSGRCSVNIWGAISRNGLGPLVRLEGRLTGEVYARLIDDVLIPYALNGPFPDGDYSYQHDQSPVHTSREVRLLLEERCARSLNWPTRGADTNPCENLWGLIKASLARQHVVDAWTSDDLWQAVRDEWDWLRRDPDFVTSLYDSMPRRMEAVIAVAENMTRY
ncbi:hypothetical protein ISCGN_001747 [Ixodes scapularis]